MKEDAAGPRIVHVSAVWRRRTVCTSLLPTPNPQAQKQQRKQKQLAYFNNRVKAGNKKTSSPRSGQVCGCGCGWVYAACVVVRLHDSCDCVTPA